MKVLALCADPGVPLDSTKGATVHMIELWRALARRGAWVTGIAPWRGGPLPEPTSGLEWIPVGLVGPPGRDFSARFGRCIYEHARHTPPDAVLERLALGSRMGLEVRNHIGAPLVVEVNAPLDREAERFRNPASEAELAAVRDTLQGADRVYCVSYPLVQWCLSMGTLADRVQLLPNGVDVEAFAPRDNGADAPRRRAVDSDGWNGRPLRAGFVGSFKPWHGLEHLIVAAALVRAGGTNLTVELLGDGPARYSLEARARGLELQDRVRFLGARPHEQVPEFLRGVDIAVAPAASAEDYYYSPLKLFEYAAAGCAIVAPDAGQVPEWLRHGQEAWLVPPAAPVALAGALALLGHDPRLRRALGAAARERAEREFDWSRVADRILAWMEATLREARDPLLSRESEPR